MKYIPDDVNWFGRGELFTAARNADQTEFAAMLEGIVPLERGMRDDVVADEHHADIPDHDYGWQDEDAALDFLSGPLIAEIERREIILGESYPFRRVNSSLQYVGSDTLVYEFCLAISLQRNFSKKPYNKIPMLFEFVAAEAARCYLGEGADFIRSGWPSHNRAERPTLFNDLMALVSDRTNGEFCWRPTVPLPKKWHVDAPKDEGVDFIVWKTFDDQRQGQIFLLGQCACGDGWETKVEEINEKRLRRWVNPITYVDFVKGFAVPHHIPGFSIFSDVSERAGLTFDRIRLTLMAQRNAELFKEKYREKIEELLPHTFPEQYRS